MLKSTFAHMRYQTIEMRSDKCIQLTLINKTLCESTHNYEYKRFNNFLRFFHYASNQNVLNTYHAHISSLDIRVPSLELLREICAPKHGPCFIKSLELAHAMQPLGLISVGVILKLLLAQYKINVPLYTTPSLYTLISFLTPFER